MAELCRDNEFTEPDTSISGVLLLHVLGDQALKIYNGFTFTSTEDERTVEEISQKFDDFAIGEFNETYERYMFHSRNQADGETFESFLATLRKMIKTCKYCDRCIDSVLCDRIVLGVKDMTTQQILLREQDLTLNKTIDICKAAENAATQGKAYRSEVVNKVSNPTKSKCHPKLEKSDTDSKVKTVLCKFWGRSHPAGRDRCSAWGKTCSTCGKKNHFARVCHVPVQTHTRKKIHRLETDETDSSDSAEWVNVIHCQQHSKTPTDVKCEMIVDGKSVTFQVDTSASVNILPVCYAPEYVKTNKRLVMWNGNHYSPLGTCRTIIKNPRNGKKYNVEFVVVDESMSPLLGAVASEQMKLITVNDVNLKRVMNVSACNPVEEYPDVFDGSLGTFEGEVHLHVTDDARLIVMPMS